MDKGKIFQSRLKRICRAAVKAGLQGVVLVPGPNLRYLTDVRSFLMERPFVLLAPVDGTPQLVVPAFEAEPYRSAPIGMGIHSWTDSTGPSEAMGEAVREAGVKGSWGFEGRVPFLFLDKLLKHASPELVDAEPVLQGVREAKDDSEVKTMKKSSSILSRSFAKFPELLKVGITETELAKKLADIIYANGATQLDVILVQSGPNAAVPHSQPTGRRIGRGESLVVDISSSYGGYLSDITRTFCLGRSPEFERVYREVLAAQTEAIGVAEEGVTVGRVDAAARGHLDRVGLGRYFTHRTGHGLGLEVHEAPYIVEGGTERLARNMFFTVEPGAYIPEKLGVRIEDDVMVGTSGGVVVTDPPKEFGWWR